MTTQDPRFGELTKLQKLILFIILVVSAAGWYIILKPN